MENKIIEYFKTNNLPHPRVIKKVGTWAMGDEVYAVSCGLFKVSHYAVYCGDGEIVSVRQRGV